MRAEGRVDAPIELGPETREDLVVRPARVLLVRGRRLPARPIEPCGSARPHEARERLVEYRLARRVEGIVRQLVNDGVRQIDRISPQRGREQGVVEPPERTEGRRRTEADVESLRREIAFGGFRERELELAFVSDAAPERAPPQR